MKAGASRRQALLLGGAMLATSALGGLAQPERLPADIPEGDLDGLFPRQFGRWQIDPVAAAFVRPANELTDRLYQQVLERVYVNAAGERVMLSVAYGQQQASSLQLHWPEVCYRAGGYAVHGRRVEVIEVGRPAESVSVTRLVATLPMRPEPVTYWAVLAGEHVPDANTFRLQRLAHAVRRKIADGLLVRISSIDPDSQRAFQLQTAFIDEMTAVMTPHARAFVLGLPAEG